MILSMYLTTLVLDLLFKFRFHLFDVYLVWASTVHHNSLEMDLPYVPVDALRFRPNIVVSGSLANEEDNWERITICGQNFRVC